MSILQEMFNRIKTTIQKYSGSTSVVIAAIAAIIFVISLGLNYVLNYLNSSITNKNVYYNWEYIYLIAYLSQLNDARMAEWQTQQT